MELAWREIGDRSASAEEVITVPAGKTMKIGSTPAGVQALDLETPTGKVRTYFVRVTVTETDA